MVEIKINRPAIWKIYRCLSQKDFHPWIFPQSPVFFLKRRWALSIKILNGSNKFGSNFPKLDFGLISVWEASVFLGS